MKPGMKQMNGFSLVEMVIVTIVLAIMATAVAPLAMNSLRAYDATLGDVVALDKLRYATERLAREIREVTYTPASGATSAAFAIGTMASSTVSFTRTYYTAAASSTAVVTVGNTGSAVTLAYSTMAGTGAQVLTDELNGVGGLTFTYLNASNVATASTVDVRSVQIDLTLSHNGHLYPQRTTVELKNYLP